MFTICTIWGSTYVAIRFAVESLPPFLMSGARFLLAGTAMYAWRRVRGDAAPSGREWRSAAVIGALMLGGGSGGVAWAEQRVPSGVASLLVATLPLWMVLLDALRSGGRRPNWREILGVLTGFTGVVVLIRPTQSTPNAEHIDLLGAAAVILAAFCWAVGSLYSRTAPLPSSLLLGTSMEMIMGGIGLLLLGTLAGQWGHLDLAAASVRSLWGFAYLTLFGSLIAFTAYSWLLQVAPISLVSTYAYINPLVAILLGYFLAKESLTARIFVAAAIIVGSVALITTVQPATSKSEKSQPEPVLVES
ncbi:MAG: EamA family transporter [Chloroflexi bacterium]|nr:EamA family transporter [Chloroflexota bacterium]